MRTYNAMKGKTPTPDGNSAKWLGKIRIRRQSRPYLPPNTLHPLRRRFPHWNHRPKGPGAEGQTAVSGFLSVWLRFTLSTENTTITRAKGNNIPFLGFLINASPPPSSALSARQYAGQKRLVKSYRQGNIRLLVDMDKGISRLQAKGYCNGQGEPTPNFMQDPQSYTVAHVSGVPGGIASCYRIGDSYRRCTECTLRYSIVMMLAAKYRMHALTKVFATAGKDLSKPLKAKPCRTSIGMTDDKAPKGGHAQAAGGELEGTPQGIPFSKYSDITQPTPTGSRLETKRHDRI